MKLLIPIVEIFLGAIVLYVTIKDEIKIEHKFNANYAFHLKGYFLGIGLIALGVYQLF